MGVVTPVERVAAIIREMSDGSVRKSVSNHPLARNNRDIEEAVDGERWRPVP
jgi:hypothetical protein